jgi:hypothetical protein
VGLSVQVLLPDAPADANDWRATASARPPSAPVVALSDVMPEGVTMVLVEVSPMPTESSVAPAETLTEPAVTVPDAVPEVATVPVTSMSVVGSRGPCAVMIIDIRPAAAVLVATGAVVAPFFL